MASAPGGVDAMVEFFLGPPGLGHARAVLREDRRHPASAPAREAFNGVFSYGGMPYDDAEANLRLFAAEVMPELKKRPAPV